MVPKLKFQGLNPSHHLRPPAHCCGHGYWVEVEAEAEVETEAGRQMSVLVSARPTRRSHGRACHNHCKCEEGKKKDKGKKGKKGKREGEKEEAWRGER